MTANVPWCCIWVSVCASLWNLVQEGARVYHWHIDPLDRVRSTNQRDVNATRESWAVSSDTVKKVMIHVWFHHVLCAFVNSFSVKYGFTNDINNSVWYMENYLLKISYDLINVKLCSVYLHSFIFYNFIHFYWMTLGSITLQTNSIIEFFYERRWAVLLNVVCETF